MIDKQVDLHFIMKQRYNPGALIVAEAVDDAVRAPLIKHRDAALALPQQGDDGLGYSSPEEAAREATLDLYHDVARSLGLLDEESSASSQHYIETGARLLYGEAL